LTDSGENGSYKVSGTLDGFNAASNVLSVRLSTHETLSIASDATIICSTGDSASIGTSYDLSGETFRWTKDGVDLAINSPVLTITETGAYQLIVEKFGCDLKSNLLEIVPLDDSLVSLSPGDNEIVFPEGGSKSISASGAESYQWFDENNSFLGDTDSITLTLEGSYRVVATLGGCQITKTFTVSYQDTFGVPNVITANGDGFNDQWVLPNTYTKDPEVNVIIYNHKGEVVLDQFRYNNNWPESSLAFPKQNMIFYYTIKKGSKTLKKGTITVIR
ncbi:MAG TPA: gliding motility-associated C-terminal domain-containing protein, partial [Arenibacter sp.]|nr:gliding motility-associated C-terminal domain-containing protein [Arenibacter sp.]